MIVYEVEKSQFNGCDFFVKSLELFKDREDALYYMDILVEDNIDDYVEYRIVEREVK
ncbi:hypothetical protein D3C85_488000 [compost metagenome]